jgi:hypothetical protein
MRGTRSAAVPGRTTGRLRAADPAQIVPIVTVTAERFDVRRIANRGRVHDWADPDAAGTGSCLPVSPADLPVPEARRSRSRLAPRPAGRTVADDADCEAGRGDRGCRARPCGGRRARDGRSARGRCRLAGHRPGAQAAGSAGIRSPKPGRATVHARERRRGGGLLRAVRLPGTSPADFALVQALWQDVPQLWVQTPEVDFTLTDRVSGRDGVHAQWAMDKNLADHLGKTSANRN